MFGHNRAASHPLSNCNRPITHSVEQRTEISEARLKIVEELSLSNIAESARYGTRASSGTFVQLGQNPRRDARAVTP
jgi:hypothetical protein